MTETPKCRGADTEIFYNRFRWAEASKVCHGCPIKMACRKDFAHDPYAYAGGMTPASRRKWVRRDVSLQEEVRVRLEAEKAARQDLPRSAPPVEGDGLESRLVRTKRGVSMSDELVAEIYRIWDSEEIGTLAIANRLGVSKSAVQRKLRESGRRRTEEQRAALARKGGRANGQKEIGDYNRGMVKQLLEAGHSMVEVIEISGLSENTVYKARRELGMSTWTNHKQEIRDLLDQGLDRQVIADKLGVPYTRVKNTDNEYKRERAAQA